MTGISNPVPNVGYKLTKSFYGRHLFCDCPLIMVYFLKWIEVNIERFEHVSMDDCLVNIVRPTLKKFEAKVKT